MLNPVKECVEMAVTLTLGCGLKLFFSQFSIHQRKTRNSYKYLLIKTEQFFYRLRYTLYSFKYFARNSLKAADDFVQLFTVTDKKKKKDSYSYLPPDLVQCQQHRKPQENRFLLQDVL